MTEAAGRVIKFVSKSNKKQTLFKLLIFNYLYKCIIEFYLECLIMLHQTFADVT